jgi:hypothetical protein
MVNLQTELAGYGITEISYGNRCQSNYSSWESLFTPKDFLRWSLVVFIGFGSVMEVVPVVMRFGLS